MTDHATSLLKNRAKGKDWIDIAGREAALLSAVEIGLGSLLHSFKIPLTGYFLSLNQGFILSRASLKTRRRTISFFISNIVAILKSLSPAGQRLIPMLAISMQGLLHSLGTLFFGTNLIGVIIGSLLSSLWSFLQPVLMVYLLFGNPLLEAGKHFFSSGSRYGIIMLIAMVALKMILAFLLAGLAFFLPDRIFSQYQTALLKMGSSRRAHLQRQTATQETVKKKIALAFKDMANPLFLVSLLLTAIFFFVVDAGTTRIIWGLLRPIAAGFILFFAIRFISFDKMIQKLAVWGVPGFSQTLRKAVETLKNL